MLNRSRLPQEEPSLLAKTGGTITPADQQTATRLGRSKIKRRPTPLNQHQHLTGTLPADEKSGAVMFIDPSVLLACAFMSILMCGLLAAAEE